MQVSHPKYGKGNITTFYEFYNTTFVDVIFEGYDNEVYIQYDSLKIEK